MDREVTSNYSYNSSRSRISYISNINNFIQDSNIYNQANLIDMLRNMRQEQEEVVENNLENVEEDNIEDSNDESNTINSYELFAEMSLLSGNKNKEIEESYEDKLLEDPDYLIFNQGRASTAPTKPLNDAEEFKNSLQYINLEKAVLYCNRLILEPPGDKFDVDSEEGIFICKKFLEQLEKLIKVSFKLFFISYIFY